MHLGMSFQAGGLGSSLYGAQFTALHYSTMNGPIQATEVAATKSVVFLSPKWPVDWWVMEDIHDVVPEFAVRRDVDPPSIEY